MSIRVPIVITCDHCSVEVNADAVVGGLALGTLVPLWPEGWQQRNGAHLCPACLELHPPAADDVVCGCGHTAARHTGGRCRARRCYCDLSRDSVVSAFGRAPAPGAVVLCACGHDAAAHSSPLYGCPVDGCSCVRNAVDARSSTAADVKLCSCGHPPAAHGTTTPGCRDCDCERSPDEAALSCTAPDCGHSADVHHPVGSHLTGCRAPGCLCYRSREHAADR